jgi:hypothetical protein
MSTIPRLLQQLSLCGVLVFAACGRASPPPAADSPADEVSQSSAPATTEVECVNEDGAPIECTSNEDCCKGFECGIDPTFSPRIRTCIGSGM